MQNFKLLPLMKVKIEKFEVLLGPILTSLVYLNKSSECLTYPHQLSFDTIHSSGTWNYDWYSCIAHTGILFLELEFLMSFNEDFNEDWGAERSY